MTFTTGFGSEPQTSDYDAIRLHADVVEKYTGQRRVVTLERADAELAIATEQHASADRAHKLAVAQSAESVRSDEKGRTLLWFLTLYTRLHIEGWVFVLTLGGCGAFALGVAAILLDLPIRFIVAGTIAPFVACIPLSLAVRPRTTARLIADAESRRIARVEAGLMTYAMSIKLADANGHCKQANDIRKGVARACEVPISQLLEAERIRMSGEQFEEFLERVFRFLGYAVLANGQSGDQGADLILTTERGDRIAVQAKSYIGSVGNDAVQQAHAAKSFYDCSHCAVITTGTFTKSARELAEKLRCQLFESPDIRDLIVGKMRMLSR